MDNPEKLPSPTWNALGLAWHLGYAIALPIVILALTGRFLDRRLGTTPWFLLAGVVLAIIISSVWVTKKALEIQRHLD